MNSIIISGYLTWDIDLRYTKNTGVAVASVGIAVKRPRSDDSDFFTLKIWGKLAETCEKYLSKGSKVTVRGHLITEEYLNKRKEPERRIIIECEEIDFGARPKETDVLTKDIPEEAAIEDNLSYIYEDDDNQEGGNIL